MMDQFPASHTTTVTSTTTKVTTNIRFDPTYVRTVPGMLKAAQVGINLLGFICAQCGFDGSQKNWFGFVSMTGFWVTLALLMFYCFHIIEKLHMIPWLLAEFGYCAVWTLFYFIAAIVVAVEGSINDAFAAASFFGFVAMILYGVDAFFKYKGWRGGEIAQGERTVTTSSQPVSPTSPSYPAY